MIPQETVNLILDTARIEEVVSEFVTLKRRGANFVACCPFHNEKTPSFYVSPSKGIFKCFGCGKAGSAVGFVMEHEHCSYVEALRYLAGKYHIEVVEKEESAEDIAQRQRKESLMLVSEYAKSFFEDALRTQEGRSIGYNYFKSRGLEDETIEKYSLGWAPRSRHSFTDAALKAGYKPEYLLETGLCSGRDDGSLSDRFYDRIVFPIHSVSGRVIAFGCRTLRSDYKEQNIGKYINSQESEIYVKSKSLYGIYFAKSEISRLNRCYLVEGYLDVLSMHQLGILNTVASSGTSLTVEQIRIIKKFTDNVTIMYDGDSAGIKAALRGIGMVLKEGLNVKVVLIPDGDDPDSYARKHTLEEVRDFIETHSRDFITFKTDLLLDEAGNDPIKRANLINDVSDTIAQIPDAVKRSVYVDAVAEKFRVESDILFRRISSTRRGMIVEQEREEPSEVQAELQENMIVAQAERDLLFFILTHGTDILDFESDSEYYSGTEEDKPTVTDFIRSSLDADGGQMLNSAYQRVYSLYLHGYDEGLSQEEIVRSLMNSSDREVASVAAHLSMEKYNLTVSNFQAALTTTSSWLVTYVPKAILFYIDKKLEDKIDKLKKALATADAEGQLQIMTELVKFQAARKSVKEKQKNN